MTGSREVPDVVAVIGNGTGAWWMTSAFRSAGIDDVLLLDRIESITSLTFDEETDFWVIRITGGQEVRARYVVCTADEKQVRGLPLIGRGGRSIGRLWEHGVRTYRGVATRRLPNCFFLLDHAVADGSRAARSARTFQIRSIARIIRTSSDRECTRVEIKSHVAEQYFRLTEARGESRRRWSRSPRIVLSDYEYTRMSDREGDDDYKGPAVLTDREGNRTAVVVHVVATYEPIENSVRWYGRISPSDGLAALHTRVNLPVTLQIDDNEPVDGLLIDSDPWGGSRISGHGAYPYPPTVDDELSRLIGGHPASG